MSEFDEALAREQLQDAVPVLVVLARTFEDRLDAALQRLINNKAQSYDDYLARFAEYKAWERVISEVKEIVNNKRKGVQ